MKVTIGKLTGTCRLKQASRKTVVQKKKKELASMSKYWRNSKALSKNVVSATFFGFQSKSHMTIYQITAQVLRRLRSVLRKPNFQQQQEEPNILKQYHEVFQVQLSKGILEEVGETEDTIGKPKHYLPHQSLITPQKDTAKIRVVFDASAHYKNCPSLNDVVHQGPNIIPKLYGMLLRFRTEKKDNLVAYRFRRVTFGIDASPFLLSATIHFHLDNYVQDKKLATEIASNPHVDSPISAGTATEGVHKYRCLKSIINDLRMNLRAFLSNNVDIMRAISAPD
ncbi:unnamed protein product [Haemonchus placei]|uniref:Reverse transcriptase domain-containing protein n=1 Tax=Haemonchus placei TaxID=6290 RepID=A0A0N4WBC8_HAEPC|nr:unnamed protein product [Haemonchus placei]